MSCLRLTDKCRSSTQTHLAQRNLDPGSNKVFSVSWGGGRLTFEYQSWWMFWAPHLPETLHMSVVWINSQKEENTWFYLSKWDSVSKKSAGRTQNMWGKSKSSMEEQRENTRRWLREWDINHSAKRKNEGAQEKQLVKTSGTDLRCTFCNYSLLHPIL